MSGSMDTPKAHAPPVNTWPTKRDTVTVGIVIPTKNRHGELVETVAAIGDQIRMPEELIIIDQSVTSSEDAVREILSGHPDLTLKYVWDPQIAGLVEARIKGVELSSTDIIFFVDDDTTLDPDCISNLGDRYIEHPEYGGISGVDVSGTSIPWWLVLARRAYMLGPYADHRSIMNKRHKSLSKPRPSRLVSGGYMSFRRSVFSEFEFEKDLWGHRWNGSIDFSYRVSAKYPVVIDPQVRVVHRNPYGTYSVEDFVRVRVAGAFFFFKRNITKSPVGWACFSWLLTAILVRSIVLGFQRKGLRRAVTTFFVELRKGISFIKKPFAGSY